MAASGVTSKTFMWGLMGLLILALGGFGVTSFTGTITKVGSVGDTDIDVETYARALQEEIRAVEAQTGQGLTFDQVELFGVPQTTLARLIGQAALDNQAQEIGLSIGDANLSRQITQVSSFAGANGAFDRDTYRFMLERAGLTEADYEDQLRGDTVRGLLQGAVISGLEMPQAYEDLVIGYAAERRDFTWAKLNAEDLTSTIPTPTDADLSAYHTENAALFTEPEKKRLTYVWLAPNDLVDSIDVEESLIQAAYDDRISEFMIPERRLVERLSFSDTAAAEAALANITSGGGSFDQAVADRGLALQDVDLGDVTAAELGTAGDLVFAANVDDVVGPVDTNIGPALFRVNGILNGQETTFDEVRAELKAELASGTARRQIDAASETVEDLLAGGATLEELVTEADMTLATLDWYSDVEAEINGYTDFRAAAAAVSEGDYPALIRLDDGGIAALRFEETLPEALQPLDDVRDAVVAAWTDAAINTALAQQATSLVQTVVSGEDLAAAGLTAQQETEMLRNEFLPGVSAEFMPTVFNMNVGDVTVITDADSVAIVTLTAINGPDLEDPDVATYRASLAQQAAAGLAQDIYGAYSQSLQNAAGLSLDQNAINAVHANFR